MLRKLFGTLAVASLLCASVVLADEIKGKITKVDPDKKMLTVSVDGKETEYPVSDDCKMPKRKDKNTGEYNGCTSQCLFGPRCGDGVVQPPEQCDDGNTVSGDSCTEMCLVDIPR